VHDGQPFTAKESVTYDLLLEKSPEKLASIPSRFQEPRHLTTNGNFEVTFT